MEKESMIGNLLVRVGLIDCSGLSRAKQAQEKDGISLSRALATLGLADEQRTSSPSRILLSINSMA
jgi:hypothetical protein